MPAGLRSPEGYQVEFELIVNSEADCGGLLEHGSTKGQMENAYEALLALQFVATPPRRAEVPFGRIAERL